MFLWVAMQNKLLTQEILQRRGCNIPVGCVLCGGAMLEIRDHILVRCNYSEISEGVLLNFMRNCETERL